MSSQTVKRPIGTRSDDRTDPGDWQDYATRGSDQVKEMVRDNAGRSILFALGAGLGVGLLLGTALGGGRRSARWWDRATAEGIGQRLLNKMEGFVPNSISDRLP